MPNRQCTQREPNCSGFQRGERGFSEFAQNDSPPYASGCSFQFLEVSECAFLMPVEHQS